MICGALIKTGNGYAGALRFFGIKEEVELRPFDKESDKAPDFRIVAADDDSAEFGAAWKRTSREGRDYISLKLEGPLFPKPIYLSLFETETPGKHQLVWQN